MTAYDKNIDYSDLIAQEAAKGVYADRTLLAQYEAARNAKIAGEGLDYAQTNVYTQEVSEPRHYYTATDQSDYIREIYAQAQRQALAALEGAYTDELAAYDSEAAQLPGGQGQGGLAAAPSPGAEGGLRRAISRAKERELLAPYLRRAAGLLASVLESAPHREDALLCRVSLLERTQDEELRRLISPDGSGPLEILESLLAKHPDSEAARRAFVRLMVRPGAALSADVAVLRRADRYAQELLAANPDDDHDLMLCLVCREQLIRFLLKSGDVEGAARERESLRGVVQLMTSREDFPQDSRRQLLELVDQMARPDASVDDHRSRLAEIINRHDEHMRRSMRRRFNEARRSRIWGDRSESVPQAGH